MQGEPLARVEAHPQRPVLPAQQAALHREARPFRLGDLDRPQRRALRPAHGRVVVVAGLRGHRQLELVGDPQHLLLDQVHVRGDAVDGVRPGQVVLPGLQEGEHAHHPPLVVLGGRAVGARRDRRDPDLAHVGQPAPRQGRLPVRVGGHDLLDQVVLGVDDRQLPLRRGVDRARADHAAPGERHHDVGGLAVLQVEQEGPQPPVGGPAEALPSTSSLAGSSRP